VDVGALEEELAELRGMLDGGLRERLEVIVAAQVAAADAARETGGELRAIKAAAAAALAEGETMQGQFEAAASSHGKVVKRVQHYQTQTGSLADHIADHSRDMELQMQVVAGKTAEAEEVCGRGTAEGYLPAGAAEEAHAVLLTRHEKAKRMVDKESQRHARPLEEVMKALKESRQKLTRLKQTISNARKPCDSLNKTLKVRNAALKEASHAVAKEVSIRFNYYLGKKGHAGKVDVDYANRTLTLKVMMHGQGETVKDTRALSGGERSFSTLALTLSLGESIESPFRAMDEFDVFMDAVNRTVSMDALIDFARDPFNDEKQFLFITPQDISAVDASAGDITVQRMKAARTS